MQSQEQDSLRTVDKSYHNLNEIIVTATRPDRPLLSVPYAIDVIGQEEIQRAEVGISLDEVLRAIPGVVVNNRYSPSRGDRISFRGIGSRASFGVRGIKIILDGIPLTMPDGQAQLSNLDLSSAGNIEILRGPSSSLYGNAAGGLINIKTQSGPPVPFLFQPRLIVGADGLRKWQSKISGNIGKHTYFFNVNKLKFDGFREHSSGSQTSVNAVGRHEISHNIMLTTVFNYFDAPYLLNPSSLSKTDAEMSPTKARFSVKQQGAGGKKRQGQGGITLKYNGEDSQFETILYGLKRSVLNAIPGKISETDRIAGGVRSIFSKRFHIGIPEFRWTIGTDLEVMSGSRTEFNNLGIPSEQVDVAKGNDIFNMLEYGPRQKNQDENVVGIGPFTELEFSPSPKWVLTLGQRYDHYKFEASDHFLEDGSDYSGTRNMDRFSPMVGVLYRPNDLIKLYSNYSTAFQTPTTIELSNKPTGEGGFNPSLQPEIMRSYEVGIKGMLPVGIEEWPGKLLDFDVTFYILTIEDMLIPFQVQDPNSGEAYYRNAGKTQNKGAEIKMDWFPAKGLRTSFAYNFMDFIFKDFQVEASVDDTVQLFQLAGNDIPGVSPQEIFAGISYEHPRGAYSEVNLRWFDKYFANDFNGPPPGSTEPIQDFVNNAYLTVDMRLGLNHKFNKIGIEFFLGINNLFDKRFNSSITPNAFGGRFFEPAPGRNYYTGVNISFSDRDIQQ
ncbi:TonB-dependent receptor family protein [Candidatus Latescibacterota bacterium]